jgi:hypothetical protein
MVGQSDISIWKNNILFPRAIALESSAIGATI